MIDVGIVLPLTTADMNSPHIRVIVIHLANLVFQVIFKQRMNSFMNRFEGGRLLKGILHQKNFYRLNLIFWIVMGCASKPQVRRASKPLGTNFETKIFKFRWFLGPSDQNELYHTPLLSKI